MLKVYKVLKTSTSDIVGGHQRSVDIVGGYHWWTSILNWHHWWISMSSDIVEGHSYYLERHQSPITWQGINTSIGWQGITSPLSNEGINLQLSPGINHPLNGGINPHYLGKASIPHFLARYQSPWSDEESISHYLSRYQLLINWRTNQYSICIMITTLSLPHHHHQSPSSSLSISLIITINLPHNHLQLV